MLLGSRETLNNLILKSPQEWHTQVALPFVKIVGTTVEWGALLHPGADLFLVLTVCLLRRRDPL